MASAACVYAVHLVVRRRRLFCRRLGGIIFVGGQPDSSSNLCMDLRCCRGWRSGISYVSPDWIELGGLAAISFSTSTRGLRPPLASEIDLDLDLCTFRSNLQLPPKELQHTIAPVIPQQLLYSNKADSGKHRGNTGSSPYNMSSSDRCWRDAVQWSIQELPSPPMALRPPPEEAPGSYDFDSSAIVRDISYPDNSLRHCFYVD